MYEEFTEVNMSAKFEAMVNNLSFMMPEQFIDDMHFAVKARLSNKITELDEPEPASDYESTSSAQLDYLTLDTGAGVLLDEDVESPQMSNRPSLNGTLNGSERRTKKQSRLSLEVVVLDKVVVRVTKELLRHLIEIYQLYLNHRSDDHSHFQYILSNKTESQVLYHQAKTADIKALAPGDEASFNFTNPYLPKLLSIKLNGWQQTNKALAVDEPSSSVMTIQQEHNMQLTRDIIVNVKPKGLKRYVELIASHQVHNDTDLCLELMTWWRCVAEINFIILDTNIVLSVIRIYLHRLTPSNPARVCLLVVVRYILSLNILMRDLLTSYSCGKCNLQCDATTTLTGTLATTSSCPRYAV